ncbi:GGDEF domain-containing protein [Halopseudomonas maritima]|uniref:GGDEF domain-containing protein n=1 Tax=Halopseudomonas maritima TaxID=2918528 RepID=UPI001EE9AF0E|nr:GGDEF domain-containing protein [Halopseudomonas maritima]UJJ30404.1 diguanylate cyclase [Halopseudomonas maritima]
MTSLSALFSLPQHRLERRHMALGLLLMFALVFGASLFGVMTRPEGFLATLWPANALLLGLMLRLPWLFSALGWVGALVAYLLPDLILGTAPERSAALVLANLAFVAVGAAIFRRFNPGEARLDTPAVVLYILLACVGGALAATLFGSLLVRAAAPEMFSAGMLHMAGFWFSSELVNGILFLPLMLVRFERRSGLTNARHLAPRSLPLVLLAASLLLAVQLDGPGRMGLPVPALLWCALSYSVTTTAILSSLTSLLMMSLISGTLTGETESHAYLDALFSTRLGIALIALGPLTVGCVNTARNDLLQRYQYLASHDHLTGVLDRGGFVGRAQPLLNLACERQNSVALMVLDIDHFKSVNDTHGHGAGDLVLQEFARVVEQSLRKQDIFGRSGGEEFSVMVEGVSLQVAQAMAERIRRSVLEYSVTLADSGTVQVTVSIGLVWYAAPVSNELDQLLRQADAALYAAKTEGRNRVVLAR